MNDDMTPAWIKASRADSGWQEANLRYTAIPAGLSAMEKLNIRTEAAHRMHDIESFYYEQEMGAAA
jgi:hypothetical protein